MLTAKDFLKEMNEEKKKVTKYKKPVMILLSGIPGSGKSTFAREASRTLGIYNLSNDYVRNYYYLQSRAESHSENKRVRIEDLVHKINKQRMIKLLGSHTSFVFDSDVNSLKKATMYRKMAKLFGFKVIEVKIDSPNDATNIDRISHNEIDYQKQYLGVIGDKVAYSSSYPKEEYYNIRARKPHGEGDDDNNRFDYIISNNGSIDEFTDASAKVLRLINKA